MMNNGMNPYNPVSPGLNAGMNPMMMLAMQSGGSRGEPNCASSPHTLLLPDGVECGGAGNEPYQHGPKLPKHRFYVDRRTSQDIRHFEQAGRTRHLFPGTDASPRLPVLRLLRQRSGEGRGERRVEGPRGEPQQGGSGREHRLLCRLEGRGAVNGVAEPALIR